MELRESRFISKAQTLLNSEYVDAHSHLVRRNAFPFWFHRLLFRYLLRLLTCASLFRYAGSIFIFLVYVYGRVPETLSCPLLRVHISLQKDYLNIQKALVSSFFMRRPTHRNLVYIHSHSLEPLTCNERY